MRRFLVVGCGGSGGATIRFIQDQLLAELRPQGIREIPAGWQFVHVDVPVAPESGPGQLGSVRDMGGKYVSVSHPGNTYAATANLLLNQARGDLAGLRDWMPSPKEREYSEKCDIPVGDGAGQYRAVGRALTLTHLAQVQNVLTDAWTALHQPNPWDGLQGKLLERAQGLLNHPPVPIVIGSMAGGSGASMFLDVCRLLGTLPQFSAGKLGTFLYSADVFGSLGAAETVGVAGNALGALGDVIAATTTLSQKSDEALFKALGVTVPPADQQAGKLFERVFPIGGRIGDTQAKFGDGSAESVFRGFGRALAALVLGDANLQDNYVQFILANPATSANRDDFGWDASSDELCWGGLGYSSISLGRDRYQEYAAQRLARSVVDRLVQGHVQVGSELEPEQQAKQRVAALWAPTMEKIGFPPAIGEGYNPKPWLISAMAEQLPEMVRAVLSSTDNTTAGTGQKLSQWLGHLSQQLSGRRDEIAADIDRRTYARAEDWCTKLEEKIVAQFFEVARTWGLPCALELVERLKDHVRNLAEVLARAPVGNPLGLESFQQSDLPPTKGRKGDPVVTPGHGLVELLRRRLSSQIQDDIVYSMARKLADALASTDLFSLCNGMLKPLHDVGAEALKVLEDARGAQATPTDGAGAAQLRSDVYREWPAEHLPPPARFAQAHNEILLMTSADFNSQFESHISASQEQAPYERALSDVVGAILGVNWPGQGSPDPEPVVSTVGEWRAQTFNRGGRPAGQARYALIVSPASLVERSRLYLERSGTGFATFRNETIAGYLSGKGGGEVELANRKSAFAAAFNSALQMARPLVGVSSSLVATLHSPLKYQYVFGEIGLDPQDAVAQQIRRVLEANASLQDTVLAGFNAALNPNATATRIAIFGTHAAYSPVVFSSLLRAVKERFASVPAHGRADLWKWKSTRPLPAALPMSEGELNALVAGWYLGCLTGTVREGSNAGPAAVYDSERSRWVPMPWPMLSNPATSQRGDWLPMVLESYLLAFVNCEGDSSLAALRPYVALRKLWDTGSQRHSNPEAQAGFRAEELIRDWASASSGIIEGADPSRAVANVASLSPQDRLAAAREWTRSERTSLRDRFIAEGTSADNYGQLLPKVIDEDGVFEPPMMRSIAPIAHDALGKIDGFLEKALGSL